MNALRFAFFALLGSSLRVCAEVIVVAAPSSYEVAPGESIDIAVYIINQGEVAVDAPVNWSHLPYSRAGVSFISRFYKVSVTGLSELGGGDGTHSSTDNKSSPLNTGNTRKYLFKWTAPRSFADFDFVTLKVKMFASGNFVSSQLTLKNKVEQGAEPNRDAE